jgi:hypothetical protein
MKLCFVVVIFIAIALIFADVWGERVIAGNGKELVG